MIASRKHAATGGSGSLFRGRWFFISSPAEGITFIKRLLRVIYVKLVKCFAVLNYSFKT